MAYETLLGKKTLN